MKFKKVEIQAFRAYNQVENGTFDFNIATDKDKESAADFVSIFAPNGFGKTSFYDAVEYGLTDSIDRFLKNDKLNREAAKSERQLNINQKGQYVLRNKFSPDNLNTEIKIHFSDSNFPSIKKTIEKVNRKGTVDFHFNKSRVQNKYFQSVILSQDWIDGFLKAEDPSDRYEKFMEYFGDKKLDDYYKKLIELINQNDKRISGINDLLKGIQTKLDFTGDIDILKKVNSKIAELNALNEKINPILESDTKNVSLNLSNQISVRRNEISFENEKQNEQLKFIDSIFSEGIDMIGIEKYFNSIKEYDKLDNKEKELKIILEKFDNREKVNNELNQLIENQKSLIAQKEEIETIINHFPSFVEINNEVQKNKKQIQTDNENKITINNEIARLKIIESEGKSKLENLNSQNIDLESQIKELPILKEVYDNNVIKSNDLKTKLENEETNYKLLLKTNTDIEVELTTLNTAIQNITSSQYPSINEKQFFEYKELIIAIEKGEIEIKEKYKNIESLNLQIKSQENFKKEIESFIIKGSEIIEKNQESICPLCNHEYDSFKTLSDKVVNNNLLSSISSSLLKQRNDIEQEINTVSGNLKKNIQTLTSSISKILLQKNEELSKISFEISQMEQIRKNHLLEFENLDSDLRKFNLLLEGVSYEAYLKKKEADLGKIKIDLLSISKQFDTDLKKLESKQSEFNVIENKVKILEKTLSELKSNEPFSKVSNYYKYHFPEQKIELELLRKQLGDIVEAISSQSEKNLKLQNEINAINDSLKQNTKESANNELLSTTKGKEVLLSDKLKFESNINLKLQLLANQFDKETLSRELNQRKMRLKEVIEVNDQKVNKYNLLHELKNNVEPYLIYEEAKKNQTDLKARKSILEKKVKKELETERNAVSKYLEDQIKSFFYEDIINDLYRRIDPHPDYKTVKFICDFREDKPKLNVYLLKDKDSQDPIIPNLYFSAAQLNILSLSIFLAKALNAKDNKENPIDCIFIDDPIQSMDSINILSTIDLLRSIVVNHKKQIILSTHDENFHNLLQKKMPIKLFNSKFMELETFGKVKN